MPIAGPEMPLPAFLGLRATLERRKARWARQAPAGSESSAEGQERKVRGFEIEVL